MARPRLEAMALPRRQRVAAYAVIQRDEHILLSRLAARITARSCGRCPGGGLDHGEDPRDAVVREIKEETGLDAVVGEQARVYSAHMPHARRDGRRADYHALRIVYDAWVPPDAPSHGWSRSTARPSRRPGTRWATSSTGACRRRRW